MSALLYKFNVFDINLAYYRFLDLIISRVIVLDDRDINASLNLKS
ncbi:hypothetical protein QIA34_06760 (plasmid) [Borreliella yangtzensis]